MFTICLKQLFTKYGFVSKIVGYKQGRSEKYGGPEAEFEFGAPWAPVNTSPRRQLFRQPWCGFPQVFIPISRF